MNERPILFSAPMVRAILDGRKTQTRRVVKPQPVDFHDGLFWHDNGDAHTPVCAYGQTGDRLWVRETYFGNHFQHPNEPEDERELHYRADGLPDFEGEESLIRWRPSIHMPRWACRLVLEVTEVRVERLQAISAEDVLAEGVTVPRCGCEVCATGTAICPADASELLLEWRALWVSINGQASWDANPWVWVVGFRRLP